MMGRWFIFLGGFLSLFGAALAAQAQLVLPDAVSNQAGVYSLSGRILEKGNKNPVLGGSLYLEPLGNTLSSTANLASSPQVLTVEADLKGRFQISVPAGLYRLIAAGEGYKKISLDAFSVTRDTHRDFYLERDGFTLPEVVVTTSKIPKTQVSHETLSKDELVEVPGTQEDVLKAIQTLPGVVTAGSLNGQLLVRGSGPNDNQYYVDNIPIGYPYHFGIVSTLDSNLVKDLDFYEGGFGPQFPNSLGGLVDVTQRDPRSDRWGFRADVNIFLSEIEMEGPITSNSSLSLSGRRSYLDLFVKDFSGNAGTFEVPDFADYQVKYSYNPSPQVHWDFVALGSADSIGGDISASATFALNDPDLAGNFNFTNGYNNQGVNFRDLSDDQNKVSNSLYHTDSYLNFALGPGLFEDNSIEDFGDKFQVVHDFDADTSLTGGLQYDHFINSLNAYWAAYTDQNGRPNETFNLTTSTKIASQGTVNSDDFSAHLNQKFEMLDKKLEISVGARADYVNSDNKVFGTPRAAVAYHLAGDTTLKASYGLYNESPDRLLGAPYLDANLGNPHLAPEQSMDTVLGVEQKLDESGLLIRVEAYDKTFSNLIVVSPVITPGQTYVNTGTGDAQGVEFFLRQPPTDRFFGWIAYSLCTSNRQDLPGGNSYPFQYDEPNCFTAVGTYKLNPGWDMGVKVLYSTGLPYTLVASTGVTAVTVSGQPTTITVPTYAATDSARLPDYFRMDFSTSLKTVYDTWEWRFYLDIVNLLGTQNVLGYNYNPTYTQKTAENDLPFLPYLGFEVKY